MNASSSSPSRPSSAPDLTESVAGEEDPGASLDLPPASQATVGNVCLGCGGSGKLAGGACPACQGTGEVTAQASAFSSACPPP